MFSRLGRFVVRRHRLVLALTTLSVIGAAAAGAGVFGSLESGGFQDPESESSRASTYLEEELGGTEPEVILLVESRRGDDVDDPAVAAAGVDLTEALSGEQHVASVESYWSPNQAAQLRSDDGMWGLVVVDLAGTDDEVEQAASYIEDEYAGSRGPITVGIGGENAIDNAIEEQVGSDLARAESLAVPATLVLLVLVFGGVVAASLPLLVAVIAVMGAFLALFGIAQVTDVSVYSINLTTALGLGLAIDYSLFIVSRFREELAAGRSSDDAVIRTVETAGRTVAFSALTVAVSLSALLIFPLYFLRSFAFAGSAVILAAAAGSLLALPALLAAIGPRVNKWSLRRRPQTPAAQSAFWHRVANGVMRRPLPIAVGVVALLLVLGSPFLRINSGLPSYESLPESSEARRVAAALSTEFGGNQTEQFGIVLPRIAEGENSDRVAGFADDVRGLTGVADVTVNSAEDGSWLTVVPSVDLLSAQGEDLVEDIRALPAPFEFWVEGDAAELVDSKAAIYDRLPIALAIVVGATAILLFVAFGSVLVPVKAILLNLLSLTATFGAMVWIFQDGNLSGVLDFTATGQLDVVMPILMFCIAFGLSMDYEVFLLSRIKEEYDRTGDNARSVATGLAKTGRLITAAALVLAISFAAFGTSGMSFMKLMGVGLALAIMMDATVVRGLLVPAFMRLAGRANWWAPAPLHRLRQRWSRHEMPTKDAGEVAPASQGWEI